MAKGFRGSMAVVLAALLVGCSGSQADSAEERASAEPAPNPEGEDEPGMPPGEASEPGLEEQPADVENEAPRPVVDPPGETDPPSEPEPNGVAREPAAHPVEAVAGAAGSADEEAAGGTGGSVNPNAMTSGGAAPVAAGGGGTGGQPAELEPISYVRVEQEVFEPAGCMAGYCHGGNAGDLPWSYEALLSVAAAEPVCGLTERVVPFEPEASVLWARVRPQDAGELEPCAEPMPKGGPPLTAEQTQLVYDWIASGAAP